MNQLPVGAVPRIHYDANAKLPPLPPHLRAPARIDARLTRTVAEGLQLTRASTIALTRLQLALAGGDRRQAMAAIDRLHLLDGEIEHLVEGLPQSANDQADAADDSRPPAGEEPQGDDLLVSLNKHLSDQKLALAFEKLALASGISGPDLVSAAPLAAGPLTADPHTAESDGRLDPGAMRPPGRASDETRAPAESGGEPPVLDWPVIDWYAFPEVQTVIWDRIPPRVWGIVLAVLVAAALVAAVVTMTMI